MPIDTAVAATTSETASATVANNSTPALRRFDNFFSVIGDAKPTVPVSSVMVVILVASLGESVLSCRKIAADTGAGSARLWRSY
jgi:hypothetical protein